MAKPKTTKAPAPPAIVQANFRAPQTVLDALDAWANTLNEGSRARWTRNAIILAVVERALAERGSKGEAP